MTLKLAIIAAAALAAPTAAHAAFVQRVDQIDRWFPSVRNFLAGVGM